LNDFFWDATYVAKYLWRNDLFYAKAMFDSSLRFEYFEKMIEWHIGSQNEWKVSTNVHGRYFPKYLNQATMNEIKETFAGSDIDENWRAFFKMVEQFTKFARQLADQLGYEYPTEQEEKMIKYYQESKSIPR
jgi:aminoglycoside 6-adenylyltransferase